MTIQETRALKYPLRGAARQASTCVDARIWWILVFLLLVSSALRAAETVAYRVDWGKAGDPLAGWTLKATEHTATVDAKLGPMVRFPGGNLTSPKLPVLGNHRYRLRFTFSKRSGTLDCYLHQFAKGRDLVGNKYLMSQKPAIGDPTPIELGFTTEPEADSIEILIGAGAAAGQQVLLAGLSLLNLGPAPAIVPDGKELLPDPGWEAMANRAELPQENPYSQGPVWIGWGAPISRAITRLPSRVHGGAQALLIRSGSDIGNINGLRYLGGISTKADAWYDFSFWAKGEGTAQPFIFLGGAYGDFFTTAGPTALLSPDEWRQIHHVYPADNPAHGSFNVGLMTAGRICLDDCSVRQVTAEEARRLRTEAWQWLPPARVAQRVPDGEKRPAEEVTLENAYLRARLSPMGGGHVTELTDKVHGRAWRGLDLLRLTFPGQPVPIVWDLPFKTAADAEGVTFSHTVTGGTAAPFLDGVYLEARFTLGKEDRALSVTYRLYNTSAGTRLPNPAISNSWPAEATIARLSAAGADGAAATEGETVTIRELAAGWMAASAADASLVWGFDVAAAQTGTLDPGKRHCGWNYLRLSLPSGGAWETRAWLAPCPLPAVDYVGNGLAARIALTAAGDNFTVTPRVYPLTTPAPALRAAVTDYGGVPLAATPGETARFTSRERFITRLEIAAGGKTTVAELFNDPRAKGTQHGIEGAGQLQYRPTVPMRVLRLPEIGNQRAAIAKRNTVLWVFGLFSQYYPLELVLPNLGCAVERVEHGGSLPEEIEELLGYRAIILSNMGACHLTPHARAALAQYVRAGGRLLVIGGSLALGNGQTTGTDLEALLPATLAGPFDTRPLPRAAQLLQPAPKSPFATLPWKAAPRLYWAHRLTPRPSVAILLTAGKDPILLDWPYGHGRVMLFAGTVEGDPQPGDTPAWAWNGWGTFWYVAMERLLKG
jgi:uncharacterized membrane protein